MKFSYAFLGIIFGCMIAAQTVGLPLAIKQDIAQDMQRHTAFAIIQSCTAYQYFRPHLPVEIYYKISIEIPGEGIIERDGDKKIADALANKKEILIVFYKSKRTGKIGSIYI